MASTWRSEHPEVLAWWATIVKQRKKYSTRCRKVEKETGRGIMISTGWGDDRVIGLASRYSDEPPPGWKRGNGKRTSGFIEPRAKGSDAKAANEIIRGLNEVQPKPRAGAAELFGTPDHYFFGLHCISPGYEEIDGTVWLTFGEYDYEPPKGSKMTEFFYVSKRSEYLAARGE